MDLSRSTNNNIEQQAIEFWQDCMLPWTERWESSIECFLLGPDSDLEVEFDMSRMMRGDAIARSQYASTMVNAGVLTRNECRDMEGLDPIDGLDEPLRPLNMVEESHAGDEIAEGDGAEDDKTAGATEARLQAVLKSNAARMARRLVAGKAVPTEALAEALGVDVATAATWRADPGDTEEQIQIALLTLGERT
jgi:hypothetical protein